MGWSFPTIFSGGGNAIYAIDNDGRLLYYAHDANNGWDVQGLQIGTGWNGLAGVASMGNGEIYLMTNNGTILRYRHDPNFNWVIHGQQIGTGWSIYFHGLIPAVH